MTIAPEMYLCDRVGCDVVAPTKVVRYHGRFPEGWIVLRISRWPRVSEATNDAVAFCSDECFSLWCRSQ